MNSFTSVWARLRSRGRSRYALLAGCCFFSTLLITAYALMMRAPTILQVLPEGGDSRKQVIMVFALAVLGCGVFTAYAAGLFFRQRSRETGVFLALGASRGQVQALLLPEVCVLGLTACGAGAVLGVPLAFGLWQLFRAFVVDSGEMPLRFDFGALAWPLAFAAYTVLMLLWMGRRSVRKASIMEVVHQSHTAEPVRAVPRFYGWLGILLTAAGCLCGYLVPTICVRWLHWYAPAIFTAPFYLPALAGLYMMLLHTVANGWGRRAAWHRDILSVS